MGLFDPATRQIIEENAAGGTGIPVELAK